MKPRCTECYHGLRAKTCLRSGKCVHINGSPRKCSAFVKKWHSSAPAATSSEIPEHGYVVGINKTGGRFEPRYSRPLVEPGLN